MCQKTPLLVLLFLCATYTGSAEKFKVTREWKYFNFTWPDEDSYMKAESRGTYVPENNLIAGIKEFEDNFYITLPRMKTGVPATLVKIPAGVSADTSPALEPFPSWEMNALGDCNALQNVQNIEIDAKGLIWIIDSGITETLNSAHTIRCPPKLLIYDLKKGATTTAYTFPDSVASHQTNFLYDIVVDDADGGYAYITDNSARDPGIIVFSVKDHHSWKIRHSQSMKADPTATAFRVNGVMIQVPINIASIALGPRIHVSYDRVVVDEDREVFYSALSSMHLYSINSSVLRNEMNGAGEYQGDVKDVGLKSSQTVGMAMDNQGILYYNLLTTNSIAKWDIYTPFQTSQKIIARDQKYLEWPNSFTFDQTGNITVLVNRLNRFIYNKLDLNEANFRLITAKVGSKSYVYDQAYDYHAYNSSSTETPESDKAQPPVVPAGVNPDPFMVPKPEQKETTESKPETTPEPASELDHGHMEHDLTNETTTVNPNKASSNNKVVGMVLGVFFACFLFLM